MLILTQDSCTICVEHTIGSEIILDTPDEPLGDLGHVESQFFPFGDSVSVGAHFAPNIPSAQKSLWRHPMVLLGDKAQVESCLVRLEIVLVLVQDRCMVCSIRGSKIISTEPDRTPR